MVDSVKRPPVPARRRDPSEPSSTQSIPPLLPPPSAEEEGLVQESGSIKADSPILVKPPQAGGRGRGRGLGTPPLSSPRSSAHESTSPLNAIVGICEESDSSIASPDSLRSSQQVLGRGRGRGIGMGTPPPPGPRSSAVHDPISLPNVSIVLTENEDSDKSAVTDQATDPTTSSFLSAPEMPPRTRRPSGSNNGALVASPTRRLSGSSTSSGSTIPLPINLKSSSEVDSSPSSAPLSTAVSRSPSGAGSGAGSGNNTVVVPPPRNRLSLAPQTAPLVLPQSASGSLSTSDTTLSIALPAVNQTSNNGPSSSLPLKSPRLSLVISGGGADLNLQGAVSHNKVAASLASMLQNPQLGKSSKASRSSSDESLDSSESGSNSRRESKKRNFFATLRAGKKTHESDLQPERSERTGPPAGAVVAMPTVSNFLQSTGSSRISDKIEAEEQRLRLQKLEKQKEILADLLQNLYNDINQVNDEILRKGVIADPGAISKQLESVASQIKKKALSVKIHIVKPSSNPEDSKKSSKGSKVGKNESGTSSPKPSLLHAESLQELRTLSQSNNKVRAMVAKTMDEVDEKPQPQVTQPPISQPVAEQLTPQERKARERMNALKEVVSTEAQFQFDMKVALCSKFFENLSKVLTPEELEVLFCNVQEIATFSHELRKAFEKMISLPPDEQMLGEIILSKMESFSVFMKYCINTPHANVLLVKLRKKSNILKVIEETQLSVECQGLCLEDFLIKPVQRVCKYPLLLRAIMSATEPTHLDYPNLKQAFEEMSSVLESINSSKADTENMDKIREIQELFSGNSAEEALYLEEPNRLFINQGVFKKITYIGEGDKVAAKLLFLFNDILLVASKLGKKLGLVTIISLSSCILMPTSKEQHFGFDIFQNTGKPKTVTVTCDTEDTCQTWIHLIEQEMSKYSIF